MPHMARTACDCERIESRVTNEFGSHAYGTPRTGSDVDILVVLEDASALSTDDLRRTHAALRGLFVPIELHFRSVGIFERRSRMNCTLEQDLATRGQCLYAA